MRNERRAHERRPRNHILKVHTGRVGSSVLVTVRRTCSTGDTSSSSASEYRGLGVVLELGGSSSRLPIEDMDQEKEGGKESVRLVCCLFCNKGWLYRFFYCML